MNRYIVESLNHKSDVEVQRFNALRRRTHSSFRAESALTIIEMLVVIVVIFILAALVLSVTSYVQNKGKRARAETEIVAMSAALESYKADNGIYPRGNDSDNLDARTGLTPGTELNPDPKKGTLYVPASLLLYKQLSGDTNANRQPIAKSYFSFPGMMLYPKSPNSVTALIDPWGNCYGYSTVNQSDSSKGYNPTFDLWSSGGSGTGATPTPTPTATPINFWIKNW